MKILNFGSLNLDFTYRVEHLARPGETVSSYAFERGCGGKGLNQSVALARAGVDVCHAGKIGKDGLILKAFLDDNRVDTRFVEICETATGHAVIQVDSAGQNSIIVYGGANRTIESTYINAVLGRFGSGDILLLQNEINALDLIMEAAHAKGMPIAFNPSPCDESVVKLPLSFVRWFVLNQVEGYDLTGEFEAGRIAAELLRRYPKSTVVLTLGEKGVLYQDQFQTCLHPIYQVPVSDTTAGGDTFTGYFLAGLIKGEPVGDILRRASAAAAIAVSAPGAAKSIPNAAQVEEFLRARGDKDNNT